MDANLAIEYISVDKIKPYTGNARKHGEKDISAIVTSIEQFGFDDPIGIWSDENIIVEGHGRLEAAKQLGMKEVPCIRLDHLDDEHRRAYSLAHNRTAELSEWDFEALEQELSGILDVDMSEFGFEQEDGEEEYNDEENENPYTTEVNIPQYEPTGEYVDITDLVDIAKSTELIERIKNSGVSKQEKQFLIQAAYRHNIFNYKKIAEYYANASEDMQELMEDSALVIIDVNDAIAKGYATLRDEIEEIAFDE